MGNMVMKLIYSCILSSALLSKCWLFIKKEECAGMNIKGVPKRIAPSTKLVSDNRTWHNLFWDTLYLCARIELINKHMSDMRRSQAGGMMRGQCWYHGTMAPGPVSVISPLPGVATLFNKFYFQCQMPPSWRFIINNVMTDNINMEIFAVKTGNTTQAPCSKNITKAPHIIFINSWYCIKIEFNAMI